MADLYTIQNQIREALDTLAEAQENGAEFSPEELDATLNYLAAMESDKVDAISYVIREKQSYANFLKSEAERLTAKVRAQEAAIARLKKYVLGVFQANGLSKLAGQTSSLSIRNFQVVKLANGLNPQTLPEDCQRLIPYKVEPDKIALARKLKAGISINGAWLEDEPSLIIR